ncbi:MAG: ABC transporter permease [Anaerofustis sp.]
MVMELNRTIIRTIRAYRTQYVGSLILIIVSCMLFTMMNFLSLNMKEMTDAFESGSVQEDAEFSTNVPIDNLDSLQDTTGATIEAFGSFDWDVADQVTLRVFSENDAVNLPAVISGSLPQSHEILLDPAFAETNGYEIGSVITISGTEFTVSGTMSLPNYIYPLESESDLMSNPSHFGIAVISKEDYAELGYAMSSYAVKFDANLGSVHDQTAALKQTLKDEGYTVIHWLGITSNVRVVFVRAKIEGIDSIRYFMPILILTLTCILTGIIIRRMIKREASVIGTLYAQGFRRKEIMGHYMLYPLLISVVGGIVGTLLGMLTVNPMLRYMGHYFNIPLGKTNFDWTVLAISIALPIVFLCVSGWFVLRGELRHAPVELMKGNRESAKVNVLERIIKPDKFKFKTKFIVREQFRSISRTVFLLFGTLMASMLLLFGFAAKSSLDFLLKDNIKDTYRFGYEYVYNSLRTDEAPAGAEAFLATLFVYDDGDNEKNVTLCGIQNSPAYLGLFDEDGNAMNTDQVIITRSLATQLNLMPGDRITLVSLYNAKTYEITVDAIAETYVGETVYLPIGELTDLLGLPSGSYNGLWSEQALDIPSDQLYSEKSIDESIQDFYDSMEPIVMAIGVLAVISFFIGLVVIYVVTSLIVEENRMTVSLMKVFGYRKKEINSLVLSSSLPVVIVGYLLGIPLTLVSLDAMFAKITDSLNLTMPIVIKYPYLILGFVLILSVYECSKFLSRKKIDRIGMNEALKSVSE